MFGRMSRGALVFGPVLMALVVAVQPAAAATAVSSSGSFGLAKINDSSHGKQGANCDYKTHGSSGAHALKDISVRGPKIWAEDTSSGTQHQWVGWKFKIQRTPTSTTNFHTVFTSSVVKAKATDSTPATFARRTWTPSSTVQTGNYRVQVTLIWYKHGSSTQVKGKQVANIDYYHVLGGGPDTVRQTDCYSAN